jgi:protein-tyrosine phosphatase
MAEDVLRRGLARSGLLGRVVVDSAGMDCAAPGRRPDLRARACARRHGGSIGDLRARRFTVEDFDRFDLILVMDRRNERSTLSLARDPHEREKVRLLGRYSDGKDIADPVHLGAAAFDRAFAQIEVACEGILSRLAPDPATNRLTGPL